MRELVELQVDDQIAAQKPVVEDEVEKVVVAVEGEALLPSHVKPPHVGEIHW